MIKNPTIALSIPNADRPDRYFSFRLKQHYDDEISESSRSERIFVVSDIEGNFQTLCRLLIRAKVINKYLQWTFADNRLVILGDCFDRGVQVVECLWLIYSLEEKARTVGGHVHFILGNHEIMNMNGDWRYVHPKYAEITKSNRPNIALYDGNNEIWRWLRTKNILEKIGNLLFVHGGISEPLLALNMTTTDINNQVRPYYNRANEQFTDPLLRIVFNSEFSPFWYRGYYKHELNQNLIDATLKRFKVKAIVTGHTLIDTISTFFNSKVININTDHASGNSEGLLIIKHRFYRIRLKGKKERIEMPSWNEKRKS